MFKSDIGLTTPYDEPRPILAEICEPVAGRRCGLVPHQFEARIEQPREEPGLRIARVVLHRNFINMAEDLRGSRLDQLVLRPLDINSIG
jgi:hypothetical protein